MNDQDKHKWKKIKTEEGFAATYICVRGDCKCKKFVSNHKGLSFSQYSRSEIIYDSRPDCYGDKPISEQNNID